MGDNFWVETTGFEGGVEVQWRWKNMFVTSHSIKTCSQHVGLGETTTWIKSYSF